MDILHPDKLPVDVPRYVPQDPYRSLPRTARLVDFYEPSYVRGPQK